MKIELPGEVYTAAREKIGFDEDVGAIFNGILEAMVECGMAKEICLYDNHDAKAWLGVEIPEDEDCVKALIIRIDGGKDVPR